MWVWAVDEKAGKRPPGVLRPWWSIKKQIKINMYYGVRWERRKHWENQTCIIVFANNSHENNKSRTILLLFPSFVQVLFCGVRWETRKYHPLLGESCYLRFKKIKNPDSAREKRTFVSFLSTEFLNNTSNNQINSWHLLSFFIGPGRSFRSEMRETKISPLTSRWEFCNE